VLGELSVHRRWGRAVGVGVAAWIGFLIGTVVKVGTGVRDDRHLHRRAVLALTEEAWRRPADEAGRRYAGSRAAIFGQQVRQSLMNRRPIRWPSFLVERAITLLPAVLPFVLCGHSRNRSLKLPRKH
jgi:hypothetical protein